jgi:tetratricopeptide (TPR) repeat protein
MDRERVPEDILSSVEEMDAIKRIKEYDVEELTREACKESLNHIKDMKANPAAELVKRALENFPDLSEYAFKIALEAREDKRDLILDVIAAEAPEPLMRIEIDEAEKLAYEIEEAPSAGVVLFSRLSSHYRNLAEKDERYLPDFAKALSNLGIALCDKGMIDEAIDKHNEALKIYRNLASEDEGYLPYLARALANLGNALSDKGIQDEAINKYNESLKIYRALVSKDKQYLPDLARTLNILGLTLLYKGAQDEAIDNFNEALKIYRTLAREDEKYLSDLAAVLVNLGNALSDEGMIDEAINKYNESLKIYRTLAVKDERHLPSLMAVLNNIGDSLSNKGLQDEAIDKYNEAFRICKTLVSRDERYLPVLAVILNNLGTALYGKGMIDEAIDKHNEALKVLEPLSDRPWIWDLMSRCHIRIAHSLISKENKKDAVEHLCRALELLTDERALKTFYSESTLADCVKFLEEIEEELIPEECKRKLKALREHQ